MVCRLIPLWVAFGAVPQKSSKINIPNRVGSRTQPWRTSRRIANGSDTLPSKTTAPFIPLWHELTRLTSFGGHPMWCNAEYRPSLLTISKVLRSTKTTNSGTLCSLATSLVADEMYHVYCGMLWMESTLWLEMNTISKIF